MKNNHLEIILINCLALIISMALLHMNYSSSAYILIILLLLLDILIYVMSTSIRYSLMNNKKAILYLVIDNLNIMNLYYGNDRTNKIINKVYKILKNEVKKNSIVKKYKDHFIIVTNYVNKNELIGLVSKININTESLLNDEMFAINLRCGIQICDKNNYNDNENKAIIAYNNAIRDKLEYYSFYDDADAETLLNEKMVLDSLVKALKNNEFEVYYQPKYDYKEKKIVGSEALARLMCDGKIVPAKDFINIAEKYNFTVYLDKYVLKEVCRRINELKKENISFNTISVNISRNTLGQNKMLDYYENVLKRYNIDKKDIEFEVTERTENGYTSLVDKIHTLSRKFNVSIDDFGIGNSSMSMLMENNIKTVKIDRQFVIDESENGRKLLNNMIKLIKELNFDIIVEGVETKEQQEYLKSKGCNVIQGYYFSKPLSFKEYKDMLNRGDVNGS